MILDPTEILCQLVATSSVNPMGRTSPDAGCAEARLTSLLDDLTHRVGLRVQRQLAEPGRENLIARLDGEVPVEGGGTLLLFDAHQDTVPVEGMTIPPFTPLIRDGRLYGRGACDVKGGMAAMLSAVSRLAQERPRGMPTVVIVCTVNEEHGFSGVKALAELWQQPGGLIPRRPDFAVVAEPTDLQVVVAHKGVVRWPCHTLGRPAHSSRPEAGDNAIYKMALVLRAIKQYHEGVVGSLASHPLCGSGTVSVGIIRGGVSVNTVPDRCTIDIDRRLAPAETGPEAYAHLGEYLLRKTGLGSDLEQGPIAMMGIPLWDVSNGELADRLSSVARGVAGNCRKVGVPYATDAGFLAAAGVPSVVFGPGSIVQAHTADEWIALDQLEKAAEIYYRFAAGT